MENYKERTWQNKNKNTKTQKPRDFLTEINNSIQWYNGGREGERDRSRGRNEKVREGEGSRER